MDTQHLDAALTALQAQKERWATLPLEDKIRYLKEIRALVVQHARAWVAVGAEFKGLAENSPVVGQEEWTNPYATVVWLSDVIGTLEAMNSGRDPLRDIDVRTSTSGQVVARVFPASVYDRLLLNGYELDVYMQPDVTTETLSDTVARFYRDAEPTGRVTLVLGAGNVASISVLDVLYSLIADGDVVLLKVNPVNEVYGPTFELMLAPLIRDGYLQIVYGGADVGEYLCAHDQVEAVHVTGSERTYQAILSSVGTDEHGQPVKPVRAELGGVSATIVVPGKWSARDIEFQAQHLATQKLFNAGHACVASQVLILPGDWEQANAFLDALRQAMAAAPARRAFYPGTDGTLAEFRSAHPDTETLTSEHERLLLVDIDPDSDHPAFRTELFGPIYVTMSLPSADPEDYLRKAVAFANERLKGNLAVNILVDPQAARRLKTVLDEAIDELRFGTIGINVWSALAFASGRAAWGAFPGNSASDIQSGVGFVHNAFLFDKPQKNVIRAPFRAFPNSLFRGETTLAVKPPWFVNNKTAASTMAQFTEFAADPKPQRLIGLFASALRG